MLANPSFPRPSSLPVTTSVPSPSYFLGCPVWACDQWKGEIFPRTAKQREFLKFYSRIFKTVEGNSTFYGIPSTDTFQRWAHDTDEGFRFALKMPGVITHEKQLVAVDTEMELFLEGLEILYRADRLGPTFIQLPPGFGPAQMPQLETFLNNLPAQYPFAVEFRHHDYFKEPLLSSINELLFDLKRDRVIFDSRPLYSMPASDASEQAAQKRKPRSPICETVTHQCPFLRLIGRNNPLQNLQWVEHWAERVVDWIKQGFTPYVFTHTANDALAAKFAKYFHSEVQKRMPLPDLPTVASATPQKTFHFSDEPF